MDAQVSMCATKKYIVRTRISRILPIVSLNPPSGRDLPCAMGQVDVSSKQTPSNKKT